MGRPVPGVLALTAVVWLVLAGCSGGPERVRPARVTTSTPAAVGVHPTLPGPERPPMAFLRCANAIDTVTTLSTGYRVIADVVALNLNPEALRLTGRPNEGTRYYVKSGLLVRPGRAATITVTRDPPGTATVGWGTDVGVDPAAQLTIPACPAPTNLSASAGTAPAWTVYAGGYYLHGPACVRLVVSSGGTSETVRVPVGKACT